MRAPDAGVPACRERVRVGILGFGVVGSGVYRMLQANAEAIHARIGSAIEVVAIGVRDGSKARDAPARLVTTNLDSIVDNPSIDVILELIGGSEPAGRLVEHALRNGKSVVTANKELIAKDGARLVELAKANGLDLHFEAAVGGGIPLVQPLKHQLAGNDVVKLMGILNGTTNFILSKMSLEGGEFADVLADAQAQGYAEADPSNDVDGIDAAYKLAILGSIAFGRHVHIDGVYREGVRGIQSRDLEFAAFLGYRVKLLGIVEPMGEDAVLARVHPALIAKTHPLATVEGVYNAVWIHGDFVGDVMFSGRGAGGDPTASAVVGDLIDVGRNLNAQGPGSAIPIGAAITMASIDSLLTEFYVRVIVKDEPKVLGNIALALGEHGVSLAAMEMRVLDAEAMRGEIVFLTHTSREDRFRAALEQMVRERLVESVEAWLRVEA
ncbi:MAG: homoserine dehydrogenase [Fimbriimonadaceae bacterium]